MAAYCWCTGYWRHTVTEYWQLSAYCINIFYQCNKCLIINDFQVTIPRKWSKYLPFELSFDTSEYELSHNLKCSGAVWNCLEGIKLGWWSVPLLSVGAEYIRGLIVSTDTNVNHGFPTIDPRRKFGPPGCTWLTTSSENCKYIYIYIYSFIYTHVYNFIILQALR